MAEATLTAERARELLDYDPETGVFRWKVTFKRVVAGSIAGCVSTNKYRVMCIDQKFIYGHRLAWLMTHGELPKSRIDHINGDKSDNRICNLRLATHSQNLANVRKPKTNRSGFKGVHWEAFTKRWKASIQVQGKTLNLGRFDCPTAGHIAYCKAAKEHFGEYARTG